MLATLQERPFSGPEWIFEIKYDGVRVLAERNGNTVELYGRNGTQITNRYPELREALKNCPSSILLSMARLWLLTSGDNRASKGCRHACISPALAIFNLAWRQHPWKASSSIVWHLTAMICARCHWWTAKSA